MIFYQRKLQTSLVKFMPKITYPITSHQNPRIKNIVKLRNRRHRDKQKMMLIEGYPLS